MLEDNLRTEGRFVQKRTKGSELKFQILPPKKEREKSSVSNDSGGDNL